jgi:hypothetical protein
MSLYIWGMSVKLPTLLFAQDVAAWLGLPTNRVVRMARRGDIPCVIVPPDEIRFDADALAEWLRKVQPERRGAHAE